MKTRTGASGREPVAQLLAEARLRQPETMDLLRRMVEIESPSGDKAAVDRCMELAATACRGLGGKARWHRQKQFGNLLEARFAASPGKSPANQSDAARRPRLLLGHLDTVWHLGTLAKMPFAVKNGRALGPGTLDMKAGVSMALTAVAMLKKNRLPHPPILLLLNSEEEVGSPVSRPVTEALARECESVFVLEPGQGLNGAYKTWRKGTGDYTVRVSGVAAHAGVDFANGHSAVLELARQIERISAFTDLERGITVNPGILAGGTQANVVAAEAWVHCDFRYAKPSDAKKIERKFLGLRPINKKCGIEVEGGVNRPPMERTKGTVALFAKAATFAAELGFELQESGTGGGSDGNFTSAIGVPTLDGMGAVGEGAHASNESILIEHLAPRTALLAAMMADW